jgi:predicted peptidase
MRHLFLPALVLGSIAVGVLCEMTPTPAAYAAADAGDTSRKGFVNFKDYAVFVPHGYKGPKDPNTYPLLLYLHGADGADVPAHKVAGLGPYIVKNAAKFPMFVIFPRGAHDGFWYRDNKPLDSKRALEILDEVQKKYAVIDPKRLYLTGVSMGGLGTWDLAEEKPDLWAAIVPVSAGQGNNRSVNKYPQEQAALIKDIPSWCFHGLKDTTVHAGWTKDMIKALEDAGGHPKATYPPDADHAGCWPIAYDNDELYDWLLKQHREESPKN